MDGWMDGWSWTGLWWGCHLANCELHTVHNDGPAGLWDANPSKLTFRIVEDDLLEVSTQDCDASGPHPHHVLGGLFRVGDERPPGLPLPRQADHFVGREVCELL